VLTVAGSSSFTTSATDASITLNSANLLSGAVSLNTSGAGGHAALTNNLATALGASDVGGNLTVTDTAGNLTQAAALTVAGASSFTTSAANATIALTNNGNLFSGAVSLSTTGGSGDVSLTNNRATVLGASAVGGSLVVTDRVGDLTQTGALTVVGTSSFTTATNNATITLASANLLGGEVTLTTSGGNGDASLTNNAAGGLVLAASSIGGNLTATSTLGNLTQSGALTVGGTSSFTTSATNATITLNDANRLTGAVSLNTSGPSGDAQLSNDRATVLGGSSVGGNLTVTDTVASLTQSGVLAVGGTSSFTTLAANADITLDGANQFIGAVSLSTGGAGGNASLSNIASGGLVLGASNVGGNLTVVSTLGDLSQSGALTVGKTSSFTTAAAGAAIALTDNGNLLSGAVSLNTAAGGSASLTNSGATVLGASTVGGNLTVRTDDISINSAVAGQTVTLLPFTATATMGLGTGPGTLSLSQTALNRITAATVVFGSTGSTGAMTVGGTVTLPSTITNLTLVSGSSIAVASGASLSDTNASSTVLMQAASLTLDGTVAVNGGNGALVLNTTGTATQSAAITASGLALLGAGGSYALTDAGNLIGTLAVNTGSVTLNTGQAVTIGNVAGTSGWSTTAASTLTAAGPASDITIASPVSFSGGILTLNAGGSAAINAQVSGGAAGDFTLTANGNLSIGASGLVTGKTVALAAGGAFINNRGSDAIGASDRWLVYSKAPDAPGENFGDLNSNNTAIWNNTYATLPPPAVTVAGNRYIFAFAPGSTPATLTVTSLNDSKTYGATANLSRFTVSGFQAGVPNAYLPDANVYSGTPAFASAGAAATANAGTYGIALSQGSLVASAGYNFAFNNTGLLTVNPAGLTITANNVTQVYDGVPFSGGSVTYGGFVNGENASVLAGTLAYGGNSQGATNVGTYGITASGLASSNYLINYVGGALTITKAPLTIAANSQTKFIGTPDPPLTFRVTNGTLVGDDNLTGALARAPGQDLGAYAITQGTLASLNYDLTFIGSTLFIEANPAGMIAPSTLINPANGTPVFPAYTGGSVLPKLGTSGAAGVNTNQPVLKIVTSANGQNISLVPAGPPP
jgi:hypothetical protein